jgi:hypothetical protein
VGVFKAVLDNGVEIVPNLLIIGFGGDYSAETMRSAARQPRLRTFNRAAIER